MNPLLEKKINQEFPDLIPKDLIFECLDGWYQIIKDVCYLIDKRERNIVPKGYYYSSSQPENSFAEIEINQIKEKFGGLRIYYYGGDDIVTGIVEMAERHSLSTCENCGKPAECKSYGQLIKTLCSNCSSILGKSCD